MKENKLEEDIKLSLSRNQISMILKSLELYCFNLHNVWGINKDEEEFQLKNSLVYHTYEQILSSSKNSFNYEFNYNVYKECDYMKKKTFYYNRRHSKK